MASGLLLNTQKLQRRRFFHLVVNCFQKAAFQNPTFSKRPEGAGQIWAQAVSGPFVLLYSEAMAPKRKGGSGKCSPSAGHHSAASASSGGKHPTGLVTSSGGKHSTGPFVKKRLRLRPDRRAETAARKRYHAGNWKTWKPLMRRRVLVKTSQLEDRAYTAKKKEDAIKAEIVKKAHAEMADIKATLARQSFRIRRARSEPERDLALEQAAQLLKEIELG